MKTKQSIVVNYFLIILFSFALLNTSMAQASIIVDTSGSPMVNKVAGNTGLKTIILAAVGGSTGAVIGRHMDMQADEIKVALPDVRVERVGEGIVIEFNDKILFGFDKSKLTKKARISLTKLNEIFKKYPDTNIEVQGHTDDMGTMKYNQALSERRASAVIGNLSENDIPTSRLTLKGFGETLPKYTNKTEVGHTQNRRVELLLSANTKMIADATVEAK